MLQGLHRQALSKDRLANAQHLLLHGSQWGLRGKPPWCSLGEGNLPGTHWGREREVSSMFSQSVEGQALTCRLAGNPARCQPQVQHVSGWEVSSRGHSHYSWPQLPPFSPPRPAIVQPVVAGGELRLPLTRSALSASHLEQEGWVSHGEGSPEGSDWELVGTLTPLPHDKSAVPLAAL